MARLNEHDILHTAAWLRDSGPGPADIPTTTDAWMAFTDFVCREGLAGLVLQSTANHDVELPSHIAARLREGALAVAADNMHALSELEGIITAFNRAQIPIMLLKGFALNLTVYPRPDLRPTSDVDLLVQPQAARHAVRLLVSAGCRRGADLLCENFFPKYHYEVELFTGSSRPTRIDLHARPFRPLRICRLMPDDAIWQGAETIRVGKAEAMIPGPERMLLQLAGHAAFHGCSRLLWLYDLRRFTNHARGSLDWSLFLRCVRQWGMSLPVLRAMERATDLLGPVCPPHVIDSLGSRRPGWRDRLTLAHAPRDASAPVAHFVVNLLTIPGLRFRLGYARAVMFPAAQHLAEFYPFRHRGWTLAAQAWRVLRAIGRIVRAPWRCLAPTG